MSRRARSLFWGRGGKVSCVWGLGVDGEGEGGGEGKAEREGGRGGGKGRGKGGTYRSVIDSAGEPDEMISSSESSESGICQRLITPCSVCPFSPPGEEGFRKEHPYPCRQSRPNHSPRRRGPVALGRARRPRLLRAAPCWVVARVLCGFWGSVVG